jgi:hypothetical protein
MLLRPDLKESMVPHRTKVRELIIQAWRQQFKNLKRDLAVIFCWAFITICFSYQRIVSRILLGVFHSQPTYGPIRIENLT